MYLTGQNGLPVGGWEDIKRWKKTSVVGWSGGRSRERGGGGRKRHPFLATRLFEEMCCWWLLLATVVLPRDQNMQIKSGDIYSLKKSSGTFVKMTWHWCCLIIVVARDANNIWPPSGELHLLFHYFEAHYLSHFISSKFCRKLMTRMHSSLRPAASS